MKQLRGRSESTPCKEFKKFAVEFYSQMPDQSSALVRMYMKYKMQKQWDFSYSHALRLESSWINLKEGKNKASQS